MVTLSFHRGTLLLEGVLSSANFGFVWDDRIGKERTEALWYRDVLQHLHDAKIPYTDQARDYLRLLTWSTAQRRVLATTSKRL